MMSVFVLTTSLFVLTSAIPLLPVNSNPLRPDHLKGVPLERDGDLNKDFRKEVLLAGVGESSDPDDDKSLIIRLFVTADLNSDQFLSLDELEKEIHKNAILHINASKEEAAKTFHEVDLDKNNVIDWNEYIQAKAQHAEEHHDHKEGVDEKEAFREADLNFDNQLDMAEWAGFLHPELSTYTLTKLAEDLLRSYDKDENGMLSRAEFVDYADGELEGPYAEQEKNEEQAREVEFDRDLDQNGDGYATLEELIAYVDPQGEGRHRREASELLWQVDTDEDGKLSLNEMMAQNLVLERSSLFSAGKRMHEDL
ncbi:unnamed protein product, partial [Mesorhabditis spiculigera]